MNQYKSLFQILKLFAISFLAKGVVAASPLSGSVSLTLYNNEIPLTKKIIVLDQKYKFQTDLDGFVQLKAASGVHTLDLHHKNIKKRITVNIVEAENTWVSINFVNNNFNVEVFQPEHKNAKKVKVESDAILLKGIVQELGSGKPISAARIFIKGQAKSVMSDGGGRFQIYTFPGTHTITAIHPKFSSESYKEMVLAKDSGPIRFALVSAGLKMKEVQVLAPRKKGSIEALLQIRQKSDDVADVIGAEQISKAGDGDAGSSLRRVTGLTLVDGKFVYIRGLGERYSNVLLNGVSLPSPDPSRRVIPMDLFPSGVLESLVIQKSYSASRSGEFGGGTVLLQTKSFPKKPFAKGSISYTYNDIGNRFYSYKSGTKDSFGQDDGGRSLPNGLSYDGQVAGPALQSFSKVHRVERQSSPQQRPSFSLSGGKTFKLRKHRVGVLGSLLYGHALNYNQLYDERFELKEDAEGNNQLIGGAHKNRGRSLSTVNLGSTLGLGVNLFKRYKIRGDLIYLKKTTDEVSLSEGVNEEDLPFRDTLLMWRERELQTHIISGENKIPLYYGFGVDWYYSHSQARLYEPDKRDYRYLDPEDNVVGNYQFGNLLRDDAYFRRYENMQDRALDVGAKMHLPIPIWGQRRAKLTVGAARLNKRRKSKVKRFSLVYRDHSSLSKEQHLAQNGLKPGDDLQTQLENCDDCYNYRDVTSNTDSYVAEQSVNAIFLESKWPVFGWLDFNMGVRNERSVQSVRTFDLFGDGSSAIESRLKTRDLMPASSLNFKVNDKMKVRLAYSETVSRPDFRELSATRWEDDDLDIEVEGNPDLQATIIKNTDIRWEWYFERKENISFGLFSKSFKNPIEAVRVPAADPVITFQNAQSALNYGFEVEFRKMIKDIKGLSLSGNYSVIQSNINISNVDTNLTNKSRPLQGQSPYAINLMLDYENERYNFATSLLYNIVGKRIFQVGNLSQPDIYEQPIPQLDFVASKSFSKSTKVRFKFKNIFNARSTLTQGDRVYRQVVRGQSVSIGISTQI